MQLRKMRAWFTKRARVPGETCLLVCLSGTEHIDLIGCSNHCIKHNAQHFSLVYQMVSEEKNESV